MGSYLWGISGTPSLGMMLSGWEYASSVSSSDRPVVSSLTQSRFGRDRHRRHANFQYANRRLLVEEGLRTVSAILPPRDSAGSVGVEVQNTNRSLNDSANRDETRNEETFPNRLGRGGWFRRRLCSFMGVDDGIRTTTSIPCNEFECLICHTKKPAVPYMTSCGHCYCYVCLRSAITDN